jgi:dihydrofolate synthase/folylpolyglutamate synthase
MTMGSDDQIPQVSSYDERRSAAALARLAALHPKLIDLGLERTFHLLATLGNPHHKLPPTVHVAGTNGKGSVIALMRAMAEAAGLRVHVYSSPHLCHFNERIRLAGTLISDGGLADLLEEVEQANGDTAVTFFEVTTAAAMLAFAREPADLLLLETGLGGALDSTNVLDSPLATVITPIARDHEHFLGNEISEIAQQKAGIMRSGSPCFVSRQEASAASAISAYASKIGTSLIMAGVDFDWQDLPDGSLCLIHDGQNTPLPQPSLYGTHQRDNAALAAAVMLHCFGTNRPAQMIAGIASAIWPGRIQRLDDGKLTALAPNCEIWVDGAHNAHGAQALAAALPHLASGHWHIICGALNTRDPREFLAPLAALAHNVTCLAIPGQDASLSAIELSDAAKEIGLEAQSAKSLEAALMVTNEAASSPGTPIIICGSLYLAGHVLSVNETPPI